MFDRHVLVSADWVMDHLDDPRVVVVEVDEDTDAYADGHLPGAVMLDWRDDLQDPLRRDFLTATDFGELLASRGIDDGDTIVLYGGNANWFAAYAYWYLKYYGHDDVRLLDGGRKKWELDGRPLVTEVPARPRGTYTAGAPHPEIRALRDEVIAAVGTDVNLVDVRSPNEFAGRISAPAHLPQEQAQARGHIPGAVNVPWSRTTREDGTFRDRAELASLYQDAGVDPTRPTIAYCRIGERSSHTWFVLSELLGLPRVRNYDGSWVEYGSLIGVPVARPDRTRGHADTGREADR